MPLVKRAIAPVYISRAQLEKGVKNELEGVVVNTLAGVIKQLSSLSKHAENLFGELYGEASNLYSRSANLKNRVAGLTDGIKRLDATQKNEGTKRVNSQPARVMMNYVLNIIGLVKWGWSQESYNVDTVRMKC